MSTNKYFTVQASLIKQFADDHKDMDKTEAEIFWTVKNAEIFAEIFRPILEKDVTVEQLKKAFREFYIKATQ